MKKSLFLFALFLFAIILGSCAPESIDENPFYGGGDFGLSSSSGGNAPIMPGGSSSSLPSVPAWSSSSAVSSSPSSSSSVAMENRCGDIGDIYNYATERCCGYRKYTVATQFCSGTQTYSLCGGGEYNPANQTCESNVVVTRCGTGSVYHNPATEQCCGNSKYTVATQFCQSGTNAILSLCGGQTYAATEYCSNGTKKTYGSVTLSGQTYKTIVIGTQTWMAENLNYNVSGSKCGNDYTLSDANTTTCDTYGRLYNWATAMNFDASCNSISCSSNIDPKHRGVCPEGWHLPSDAEWNALIAFVHSDNGLASYISGTSDLAGKYLKAANGWNSYSGIVNDDKYGFAALPGGLGTGGDFGSVGLIGLWWSASEGNSHHAYDQSMSYNSEGASWYSYDKDRLYSLRCVKD
jgi:uncharacterized protein (TIGR02145 family)